MKNAPAKIELQLDPAECHAMLAAIDAGIMAIPDRKTAEILSPIAQEIQSSLQGLQQEANA